jgi:4-amino-4-deoxy-L-arabinose transferase-like glycosyltransferase
LLHSLFWRRTALALLCGGALFLLYFFGLTRTGLLGPDEPRYAAIGRAMAETGDWITPRLWGEPWFEKPALLYWMTALGFKAGLGPDLAPRLPVAIVSVGFLAYFFVALRRDFGAMAAFCATTILATSAGWLAYSHVAVTDLPMSATFAAAMLVLLRKPLTAENAKAAMLAGALLGLALLAKGLVPLVLFVPAVWFFRCRIRDLILLVAAAAAVALPWYIAVTLRNGTPFLEDFIWKQHFQRFATGILQHEQPSWFFLPVLVAGFFPWSPLLLLLFERHLYKDRRLLFLLAWLVWGFLFFSVSRNKLPGYLLPLMPAAAALLGIAVAQASAASIKLTWVLAATALLFCLIPAILNSLPQALLNGISRARPAWPISWIAPALIAALSAAVLERTQRRAWAITMIGALVLASTVQIIWQVYPRLDLIVSARSSLNSITCIEKSNRSRRYGLDYYAGRTLPDCN